MKLTPQTRTPGTIVDCDSYFDTYISFNPFDNPEKIAHEVHLKIKQDIKNTFGGHYYTTITPLKTFRNKIYPNYKSKRKPRSEQKSLALQVFMTKNEDTCIWHPDFEADDITVYFMRRGAKILATDKDITGVATTQGYNYGKRKMISPKTQMEAEAFAVYQSMMGDSTDGIPGAKDIGKKKAHTKIEDGIDIFEWVALFDSIEQAELMMQLVRMDQIDDECNLRLWKLEDWKLI